MLGGLVAPRNMMGLRLLLFAACSAPSVALASSAGRAHGAAGTAVIRMERAARELAATLVYSGVVQNREPLELLNDEATGAFWFERPPAAVAADLKSAAEDRVYSSRPLPQPSGPESASPLLANRARRAQVKIQVVPPTLQTPAPVPKGATPIGDVEVAPDRRSGASRSLVRQKLAALQERRVALEEAIGEMLDPLAAPKLAPFDLAVLLLFLSEIEAADLPVPVACKEAAELCTAYSGGKSEADVRHVQGVLGAYARERLGRRM